MAVAFASWLCDNPFFILKYCILLILKSYAKRRSFSKEKKLDSIRLLAYTDL